jgi:peptidoglycan/LPS O-acetylase OafA/YrhL
VDFSPARARTSRPFAFDLLRLGAAIAVLLSHSYAVVGRHEPGLGTQSVGNIAVLVFFGISGFLIAQSWQSEPRLALFVLKRALRILPALIVVLLISALVIGPLVTDVRLTDYVTNPAVAKYVVANTVMHTTYGLPGVFDANPMTGVVNGSLWTLKHEVLCYAMIAALGLSGLLRRRAVATAILLLMVAVFALLGARGPAFFDQSTLERTFAVAALLAVWQDRVPWRWPVAVAGLLAWGVATSSDATAGGWLAVVAIPYAVITLAGEIRPAAERWLGGNDVSYGVYLWAFPVQQLLVLLFAGIAPLVLSALALPLTVAVALASWVLVERPALGLKSRMARRLRGRRDAAAGAAALAADDAPAPAPTPEPARA